jgi:hypothetical protein
MNANRNAPVSASALGTARAREVRQLDEDDKPKGDSVADSFLLSSLLHDGSRIAGRVDGQCVELEATYHAQMCTITAILADGRISLQGAGLDKKLPGIGGTDEVFAVTGGTGAYVGASGSMTIKGNGQRDTLTFTLG